MIKEESEDVKKVILRTLKYRLQLLSHLLDRVASFLGRNVSTNLTKSAVSASGKQTTLPENILKALVDMLSNGTSDISSRAERVLFKQNNLYANS